jgi:hypothetical protein
MALRIESHDEESPTFLECCCDLVFFLSAGAVALQAYVSLNGSHSRTVDATLRIKESTENSTPIVREQLRMNCEADLMCQVIH